MNNILRKTREDIGMPLSELARRAGTSRETITKIELYNQIPNGLLMLAIAAALRLDPREIFFATNVKQNEQNKDGVIHETTTA